MHARGLYLCLGQSIHVLDRTLGSSCCVLANPFKVSFLRDDTIIGLSLQIIDCQLLRSNIGLSIQECGVLEGGGRGARLPDARAC